MRGITRHEICRDQIGLAADGVQKLAASVRWSISSLATARMISMESSLASIFALYAAVRYGGIVACSSWIAA